MDLYTIGTCLFYNRAINRANMLNLCLVCRDFWKVRRAAEKHAPVITTLTTNGLMAARQVFGWFHGLAFKSNTQRFNRSLFHHGMPVFRRDYTITDVGVRRVVYEAYSKYPVVMYTANCVINHLLSADPTQHDFSRIDSLIDECVHTITVIVRVSRRMCVAYEVIGTQSNYTARRSVEFKATLNDLALVVPTAEWLTPSDKWKYVDAVLDAVSGLTA